jgi:hypothetical protein
MGLVIIFQSGNNILFIEESLMKSISKISCIYCGFDIEIGIPHVGIENISGISTPCRNSNKIFSSVEEINSGEHKKISILSFVNPLKDKRKIDWSTVSISAPFKIEKIE